MPLSALYLGERIESWSMTPEAWAELKRDYRTTGLVMACGRTGVPKTSRLGTRFFAHKPGTDCELHEGGPESPEHLATKAAVARAAREIGWEAVIEFAAEDRSWIADVLVSNGEQKIAIEAQWSPQSQADFERRQARYEAAGIACFWLTAPVNTANAATVPHYRLDGDAGNLSLWLPTLPSTRVFELVEGVKAILQQEVALIAELVATSATITTQMSKCWHCKRWMSLWTVSRLDLESRCGGKSTLRWPEPWALWALQRHEQALEAPIRQAINDSDLPAPVSLQVRKSDRADRTYLAMTCPSCHRVQGDGLLSWHREADHYSIPLGTGMRLPFHDQICTQPHVCRTIGRGRCSQQLATDQGCPEALLYPPANESFETHDRVIDGPALPPRGSRPKMRK